MVMYGAPYNERADLGSDWLEGKFIDEGAQVVNVRAFGKSTNATTKAGAVQAAITFAAANSDVANTVFIPEEYLGFDPDLVDFDPDVRMVAEGGNPALDDLRAYGGAGDGETSDVDAFNAAIAAGRAVGIPSGTWMGPFEVSVDGVELHFGPDVTLKLPDQTVDSEDSSGTDVFHVSADDVLLSGDFTIDGNVANQDTSGLAVSSSDSFTFRVSGDRVKHVGKAVIKDAYWFGFGLRHATEDDTADDFSGDEIVIDNPKSWAAQIRTASRFAIETIRVRNVSSTEDHRVRLGTSVSESVGTTDGEIGRIITTDNEVVVETDTEDVKIGYIRARRLKVGDSKEVSLGVVHLADTVWDRGAVNINGAKGLNIGFLLSKNDTSSTDQVVRIHESGDTDNPSEEITIETMVLLDGGAGKSGLIVDIVKGLYIGTLISKRHGNRGVWFRDQNSDDQKDFHIGTLVSRDNTGDNLRIELGIGPIRIDHLDFEEDSSQRPLDSAVTSLEYRGETTGNERVVKTETLDLSASATASGIIPADSVLIAVLTWVTSDITLGGGGTEWRVGDGSNVDRWGVATSSVSAGQRRRVSDYDGDDAGPVYITSSTDVVLSQDADDFTSGEVLITVIYDRPTT